MANGGMQGMGMMVSPNTQTTKMPMQEKINTAIVDGSQFREAVANLSAESSDVLEQHLTPRVKEAMAELFGPEVIDVLKAFGPTEPIWEYWGTPGSSIEGFYSGRQSGAFRLPNGNTFVIVAADTFLPVEIESNTGHMFEVDRNGNIVWEYIAEGGMAISRAHQYGKDYLNFNEI